jgi:hypothetical protein
MAAPEALASLVSMPLGVNSNQNAAVFLTTDVAAALPLWGACCWTVLGAAFGSLVLFVVFQIKNRMSPESAKEGKDEGEPLLPASDCTT